MQELIPQAVLNAFQVKSINKVQIIGGGKLNHTFLLTEATGGRWIVHKLNTIFEHDVTNDAAIITKHLSDNTWDCPSFKTTKKGEYYVKHDGAIWRMMHFVEHAEFKREKCSDSYFVEYGALLGQLHKDLAKLEYEPLYKIEGFHDQRYFLEKAHSIDWTKCTKDIQEISRKTQKLLGKNLEIFKMHIQIIHGDPRVANVLHNEEMSPFLFIDYDTFMKASVFVDIGDAGRAILNEVFTSCNAKKAVQQIIEGYNKADHVRISYKDTVIAIKTITLEQVLRYLNDIIFDCYYEWDKENFSSRKEQNTFRAKNEWKKYLKIEKEL